MIFDMGLTHLGSEASISINTFKITLKINYCFEKMGVPKITASNRKCYIIF